MPYRPTPVLLSACIVLFHACTPVQKDTCAAPGITPFRFPVLINTSIDRDMKLIQQKATGIQEANAVFIGRYNVCDTVDVSPMKRGFAGIDNAYASLDGVEPEDSLDTNGFELYVDYDHPVFYMHYISAQRSATAWFPVYLFNASAHAKYYLINNITAIGIQEVQSNRMDDYEPIEVCTEELKYSPLTKIIVDPGQYILILFNRYDGDDYIPERVRIDVGETRYVSKPFRAFSNAEQTETPVNAFWVKRLVDYPNLTESYFLGSNYTLPASAQRNPFQH